VLVSRHLPEYIPLESEFPEITLMEKESGSLTSYPKQGSLKTWLCLLMKVTRRESCQRRISRESKFPAPSKLAELILCRGTLTISLLLFIGPPYAKIMRLAALPLNDPGFIFTGLYKAAKSPGLRFMLLLSVAFPLLISLA
jgi:hypothetical protein